MPLFALFCGFLAVLGYFVYNGAWYAPAELVIKGEVGQIPAAFDVSWDSGNGYNRYEKIPVTLLLPPPAEGKYHLRLTRVGERHGGSLSKDVLCNRIVVDGELVAESVHLTEQQPEFRLELPAQASIAVELATNTSSGQVGIAVNELAFDRDLYIANVEAKSRTFTFWLVNHRNQFTANVPLPRYAINTLTLTAREGGDISLTSVAVHSEGRIADLLLQPPAKLTRQSFSTTQVVQKRHFSWQQLGLQTAFALLSTWLFSGVWRLYHRCGGLHGVFAARHRVFWMLLFVALGCYLLWLMIFWPGILSVDSLKIWRAAQLPEVYLNDHPILNVLLYSYLYHIWNNPAVVGLFQVGMSALLVAWIFTTLHRQGISLWLLLPFYGLAIVSVPVGLYNTVLWKDIPFALLIVFWAFTAVTLYHPGRSQAMSLSAERLLVLCLLLLSLALIRHNGIIYLVFIPLLFLAIGVLRLGRAGWWIAGGLTAVALMLLAVLASGMVSDSGYLLEQGRGYLRYLLDTSPQQLLARTWTNYWGILDINQTASKWDLWHYYLNDRRSYVFLQHAGWHDVYPYIPRAGGLLAALKEPAMAFYWASYTEPLVYLTWNPLWVLALMPLCLLGFRWLPRSAIFSAVILAQVITLAMLLNILNWRYYYFVCLAGYFLVPIILLDIQQRKRLQFA